MAKRNESEDMFEPSSSITSEMGFWLGTKTIRYKDKRTASGRSTVVYLYKPGGKCLSKVTTNEDLERGNPFCALLALLRLAAGANRMQRSGEDCSKS